MSTLNEYIKSQPKKPRGAWADDFGISRPYLYALLDGTRAPSLEVAKQIEAATGNQVPVTAWPNLAAVVDAARRDA